MSGTGGLTLSAGTLALTGPNTFTGTTSVAGGATLNLRGTLAGPVSNGGTVNLTEATSTGAFANAGTGILDLTGIALGQGLTVNGAYTSTGGRFLTRIDLNTSAGAGARVSALSAGGAGTGATTITFSNVGTGPAALLASPIVLASGTGTATFSLDAPSQALLAPRGFATYSFGELSPGTWGIRQSVDAASAASAGTQVIGLLGSLNTSFFQSASTALERKRDAAPNTLSGGPWIRYAAAQDTLRFASSTTLSGASVTRASRLETTLSGYQVGADRSAEPAELTA